MIAAGNGAAAVGGAVLVVVVLVIVALYFLPTIIAAIRHHHQVVAIAVLNVFAGWIFVGWVAALVWSATYTPGRRPPSYSPGYWYPPGGPPAR